MNAQADPREPERKDANTNFWYRLMTAHGEMPADAELNIFGQWENDQHQKLADKNSLTWNRWWWTWLQAHKADLGWDKDKLIQVADSFDETEKQALSQDQQIALSERLAGFDDNPDIDPKSFSDLQVLDLSNLEFGTAFSAFGLKFLIRISCELSAWRRNARFTSATFSGFANFDSATFSGFASFDSATFSGIASFTNVTFSGDARFHSATFSGNASFTNATFSGNASFNRATFSGDAWFNSATFSGFARFDSATFSGDAWFNSATFSGDAWFNSATFSGHARFHSATFSGGARFDRTTFSGHARFDRTTFSGDVRFHRATFSGDTRFDRATFSRDARFNSATFSGDAWFNSATFSGDTSFTSATFSGDARFDRTTFSGDVRFHRATFSGDTRFDRATFSGDAWFNSATFGLSERPVHTQFDDCIFAKVPSLSTAIVHGTIQFNESPSAWPQAQASHLARDKNEYAHLRKLMLDQGRQGMASLFQARIHEARRRQAFQSRTIIEFWNTGLPLSLYAYCSSYGFAWFRPMFVASILFIAAGFGNYYYLEKTKIHSIYGLKLIELPVTSQPVATPGDTWILAWQLSASATLTILPPPRFEVQSGQQSKYGWLMLWNTVQRIISGFLLFLFGRAIGNRLRLSS